MTTKTDLELTKKDKKKFMGKKRNILNQVFFKKLLLLFQVSKKSQCILPIFQPLIYFPLRTKTRKVACLGKIKNV